MNTQREMFDEWWCSNFLCTDMDSAEVAPAWSAWQAAVAAQQDNKQQWQSVSHPPEKHVEVMVWPYPSDYCMTAFYEGGRWHYAEYEPNWGLSHITCFPTHWMPLPQEPNNDTL